MLQKLHDRPTIFVALHNLEVSRSNKVTPNMHKMTSERHPFQPPDEK